ncbi:MAG TPA: murein L,D-transpeptidase catalytic domain family protein [Thermoanaerobaculia bacterium]|nr:murein L,D-transpeptidase catalytic domain family protein [Thermoanaerobaculia bacterium]
MKRSIFAIAVALLLAPAAFADESKPCTVSPSDSLLKTLVRQAPGLRSGVLRLALDATGCAEERGLVKRRDLLTVIDYSLPSTQPRLFTFDLIAQKLLFRELVAHGKNSGGDRPSFFSNSPGSLATSLGLYVTADTYFGGNGYSLRLKGLEEGVNDMAWDRAVVMHGASYVSRAAIAALGRLGRSWGCPAVRPEVAKKMIDTIRGGTPVFAYYPEKSWLANSRYLSPVVQKWLGGKDGKSLIADAR